MIKAVLSDSNGEPSTIRVITMFVVVLFLCNWTYFNIRAGSMQPFPADNLIAILGVIALKVTQRALEPPCPPKS